MDNLLETKNIENTKIVPAMRVEQQPATAGNHRSSYRKLNACVAGVLEIVMRSPEEDVVELRTAA